MLVWIEIEAVIGAETRAQALECRRCCGRDRRRGRHGRHLGGGLHELDVDAAVHALRHLIAGFDQQIPLTQGVDLDGPGRHTGGDQRVADGVCATLGQSQIVGRVAARVGVTDNRHGIGAGGPEAASGLADDVLRRRGQFSRIETEQHPVIGQFRGGTTRLDRGRCRRRVLSERSRTDQSDGRHGQHKTLHH